MTALRILLLIFLIICAVAVSFSKRLLVSIIIYMAFSLIMSILWMILKSLSLPSKARNLSRFRSCSVLQT